MRSPALQGSGGARRPGRRLRGWFIGDEPDFRRRSVGLLAIFMVVAIGLTVRLADVQIRQGARLAAMAERQHVSHVVLHGRRGNIYDRTGRLLASNRPVYDVFADPGLIPAVERPGLSIRLAPILTVGPARLQSLLATPSRFVYLSKSVSSDVRDKLAALDLPGIGITPGEQRVYAASPVSGVSFASTLLGFVDHDGAGQYGVEGHYDAQLRGSDGSESTLRDLAGNSIVLSNDERRQATNGDDLKLGLDSQVQYWAEQALAKGLAYAQADSAELMVMDTKTGAIRAWAELPSYDANHFADFNVGLFRDQAVSGLYEPGSVMKVVTFAAGLDRHVITPDYTFDEGPVTVDGFTINDWDNRAHGRVTMQTVLEQSLNDGAIKIMQLMGNDALYSNLLGFGIGATTGVDLAGEVNLPIRPQSQWRASDYATASFGQGVVATPVEMLAAVNAVANGGVWVQPHAVETVVDSATGKETAVVPSQRRVMSAPAAATLRQMMTGVTDGRGASGFLARIPSFKGANAGKTGTASEPTNGRYSGDIVASYVGFLPAAAPQFTMFVVIRSPHENQIAQEGAYLAAPVWKDVAQIIIDQWRIAPP